MNESILKIFNSLVQLSDVGITVLGFVVALASIITALRAGVLRSIMHKYLANQKQAFGSA